jgi:hypothetical protein
MRSTLPVIVAFLSGIAMVISFFFNPDKTILGKLEPEILVWATIIAGFSMMLGVVSLVQVNLRAVIRRKKDWIFNLLTLVSMLVMGIPALLPSDWSPLFGDTKGSIYDWLFLYLDKPMMATMFGMLAFYIASAAYRAFRARSAEATLLLITAALVMLWRVPMGESLLRSIHTSLPDLINTYIMNGVNMAVQRGIVIGAALGAASMSLRIVLGIERTYMGKN